MTKSQARSVSKWRESGCKDTVFGSREQTAHPPTTYIYKAHFSTHRNNNHNYAILFYCSPILFIFFLHLSFVYFYFDFWFVYIYDFIVTVHCIVALFPFLYRSYKEQIRDTSPRELWPDDWPQQVHYNHDNEGIIGSQGNMPHLLTVPYNGSTHR